MDEAAVTLKEMVAEVINVSPATVQVMIRPPLAYQSNRLYDVRAGDRHLIAKEYLKPEEFETAPVREYKALELLAPLSVAPQPVAFCPQTAPSVGPLVIYDFVEGQMWDRRQPAAAELRQLAQLWLRVNSVSKVSCSSRGSEQPLSEAEARFRATFETYADWARVEFPPGEQAADLCLDVLARRHQVLAELAGHDPPLCFGRSDARFANVIRRPDGRLAMVDWEDSGLYDPARAVADLITHANQEDLLSPQQWQAFVRPYLEARGRTDSQLPYRVHLYLALFPLFWLAILVRVGLQRAHEGRLAGWHVNQQPANVRLRRYLARGIAWPALDFWDRLQQMADVTFFPHR